MEQAVLREFEAKCVQDEPPACQTTCPLHVEARTFIALMQKGELKKARQQLDRTMPLSCLVGLLCTGACQAACNRTKLDASINLPMLERACILHTQSAKPFPLPGSHKQVAVLGAGLSSLVVAWELGKKGHEVVIWQTPASLSWTESLSIEQLPKQALQSALEQLQAVQVKFLSIPTQDPLWFEQILQEYQAVYVGGDDFNLAMIPGVPNVQAQEIDALTLGTKDLKIFMGGFEPEYIQQAAAGKRAAGSIDRLLQGVSPGVAREKEGTYPSRLYTDLSQVKQIWPVPPAVALAPTLAEAKAEAERCILCECLECVKKCVYLANYKGYPKKYCREIYNNLAVVHGLRQANLMTNSCAECGLCSVVCPQGLNMGDFCAEARHTMVTAKRMPLSAHEFALEDMQYSQSLSFFRHQPGQTTSKYVFFPGCQLPASLPEQTKQVYVHLQTHLADGIGFMLSCCGAPARWASYPQLTQKVVHDFKTQWQEAGQPELIVACASCATFFKAECPEITVHSLWTILADLPLPAQAQASSVLALHDPCASRQDHLTQAKVRKLLTRLGQEIIELPLGRELTRCCGYGGLAANANPELATKYTTTIANDTEHDLLTYCIMCRDRLYQVGKPTLHLLDLLFPDATNALQRPAPNISQRQETRLAFVQDILQTFWHESQSSSQMDDFKLNISPEIEQVLDARRILHTNIQAVLQAVQEHGAMFYNPNTGRSLSCLRPRQVSYWVEYTLEADHSYTIHNAYCHRMQVPGVPGDGQATSTSEAMPNANKGWGYES